MSSFLAQAEARERFRRNVTRAQISDLLGLIIADDRDLVSYDEVVAKLQARQQIEKGTEMVPLENIVGSVGRYRDFTRDFLPRAGVNQERWTRLDAALNSMEGFPPVELFKIGEVYFVRDGNHRVSVARANGSTHIEAYVTEIETDIPLTLDDFERDQWLIKIERAKFLEATDIDEIRPNHGIEITEPGRYEMMLQHIEVHRFLRDQELERKGSPERLSWHEAVASWYDTVYMPVVQAIRDYDLLHNYPGRTEADLYLWIALHRERLAAAYGLAPLSPTAAVSTFAQVYGDTLIQRTVKGLLKGLHWVMGDERPLGLSEAEYQDAKARHAAGELTLGEVEALQARLEAAQAHHTPSSDGELDGSATDDPLSNDSWHARLGQRMEF
ncbi:MAG: hypothetical protein IT328_08455 [Caldilineaceae bacterium]|nr:hypothetical protein [Caldilineaceae bacterium]